MTSPVIIKGLNSTVAKRRSVFIRFMTPAGAILLKNQRGDYDISAGGYKDAPKVQFQVSGKILNQRSLPYLPPQHTHTQVV